MSPRQIAWIGFDDERFEGMQTSDFNSILEAYMEMFPDIPIKDVSFSSTKSSALPKYYFVDNGLRQSVLLPGKDDDGILFENAVFLQLLRNLPDGQKICYYLGDKECDFVIQTETAVNQLIQVCRDMKDKDTRERELNGIREAATLTGCSDLTIVTRDMEEDVQDALGIIHIVPAWKWFLGR